MLLAIDTSAGTSVAIVSTDGNVIDARHTDDTRRHAEVLGEYLSELRPEGVCAVVIGVGPGPFTGLRVGIAAARGFAWGANIPLWPVLSHDGIALTRYLSGETGRLTVATDARRREFFVSDYYGLNAGIPERHNPPRIEPTLEASVTLDTRVDAAALARVAIARNAAGEPLEPANAVYLRSPDVTLPSPRTGTV